MLFKGDTDLVSKEPAEVFAAETEVIGDLFQRNRLVIVFVDV